MRLNLQGFALATSAVALSGCGFFPASRPPDARFTLHVADAAMAAGAPNMALRVAEIVLRRDPHDVSAMLTKGQALYAMGADDRAQAAYRQAVAADPSNPQAQIGLGRTLLRSDPGGAEAAFLAALTQQPDNVVALNDLGIARDMLGQHAQAQASYRQALGLSPESGDVQTNLGLSLALSGDRSSAVKLLQPLAAAPGATVQRANLAVAMARPSVPAAADDPVPAPVASIMAPLAISPAPVDVVRREALPARPSVAVAQQAPAAVPAPALTKVRADAGAMAPAVPVPRAAATPATAPVRPTVSAAILAEQGATAPVIAPLMAKPAASAPNKWAGLHYVHTTALNSAQGAFAGWGKLPARWPDQAAGRTLMVQQADIIQRTFWRLRSDVFVNADSANEFYARLYAGGPAYWTVQSAPE